MQLILFFTLLLASYGFANETQNKSLPTETAVTSAETGDGDPFQPVSFQNGIQFSSPDHDLKINMRFRMQNRIEWSKDQIDAQVRRLRLRFGGTVGDPRITFNLQLGMSRADMDWEQTQFPNIVRDALIIFAFHPNFSIAFGQGKLPGNRQRVVSSGDLQFVDRSIVNQQFNLDRDFGIQFYAHTAPSSDQSVVQFKSAMSTGEGRNRPRNSDFGLNYVGRIEWLPLGNFTRNGDYFESDLLFEKTAKLSFGLGGAFHRNASRARGTIGPFLSEKRDQTLIFGDGVLKYRGYALSFESIERKIQNPILNADEFYFSGRGLLFQAGKMLNTQNEVAIRFATVIPDSVIRHLIPTQSDQTLVWSHFLNGHRIKIQSEISRTQFRTTGTTFRLQAELGI